MEDTFSNLGSMSDAMAAESAPIDAVPASRHRAHSMVLPPQLLVMIPAHNESESIVRTLECLQSQTVIPDGILVVADNCTDDTAAIAGQHGASVIATADNSDMKAGALNQGFDYLLPLFRDIDLVLIMDADSVLNPRWIEFRNLIHRSGLLSLWWCLHRTRGWRTPGHLPAQRICPLYAGRI